MRSQLEQQDQKGTPDYRELQLLSEILETPDVTQRQLSNRIGIALGITNILVRNLVQKGYLRVGHSSWKRRLYTLTPEGFSQRLRLTVAYIQRVLDHYQRVRQTLREQLDPLALNEESCVAIYGTGEFAELVYLGLKEIGIEEIDVFDSKGSDGRRFLGMPVRNVATLDAKNYDRVLVAFLGDVQSLGATLREHGASSEQLVAFFADGKARESL